MKNKKKLLVLLIFMLTFSLILLFGCKDNIEKDLMLYLSFDEGQGTQIIDKSDNLENTKLQYVFNDAKYQPSQDPQWRQTGIRGGSLLMDGYSNFIRYDYEEIEVKGASFTISVWVAPRQFEWSNPNAVSEDNEHLTAIVSQYNKTSNQGFILGYHKFGSWSFQVGLGDRWIEVWDNDMPLDKYEWNYLTATFDGINGKVTIYKNGEIAGETRCYENAVIAGANDIPLLVGKNNDPDSCATASYNMHSGLIDEVKLYSKVMSSSDINNQFKEGLENEKLKEITFEDIWLQDILTEDINKPQYHGGPPQHWMNEPHAPMYYNGVYHLFFQFNLFGPYFRNICWGHLISDDMVTWKALKEIITPTKGTVAPDGIWAGGVTYDNDGVPAIFITAGNDSYAKNGLISNQNIGLARPKDITDPYLTEWIVDSELVIKQQGNTGRAGDFRDPHVWKEGDEWYMLICSAKTSGGTGGTALLYTTKDDSFKNWIYRGPIYEMANQPGYLGETWELPVMLPLTDKDGNATGKHIFMFSPAPADRADNDVYYWLGTFNKTTYKFIPDFTTPKLIDYGNNVFTGPSGFIDPTSGRAIIFSIMQDQRKPSEQYYSGWAHNVGLARQIWLGDDGMLKVKAISEVGELAVNTIIDIKNKSLNEANALLSDIKGDMLRIQLEITNVNSTSFGIYFRQNLDKTEQTSFIYDTRNNTIGVNTGLSGNQQISGYFKGELLLENNKIKMDIYLDRSQIEGYFNDHLSISARIYPEDVNSKEISLFADGGEIIINSLIISEMGSIHET
jgi:sucrose-6-phosphate hydrolase SacC (GH32 family)